MRRFFLFTLILLLVSSFLIGCSVREELQFTVELRDKNLGFTVENFSVACIVSHPELVDTLNITLVDQNGEKTTLESREVSTITELSFTQVADGTYQASCVVCRGDICREDTGGTVLVSLEEDQLQDYEFDLPPSFILGTPIDQTYFLSERPLLVSFSCLANDDVGLTAVSLVSNVSGLFSETFIQNPTKSSHLLTKDLVLHPGKYVWTCRATDTRAQTVVAPVRSFIIGPATPEILPNTEGFDGDTTDFSKLDRLTDVPGVIIEDTQFGKISFVDNISSLVGVDLSKGIIITSDSITVNSSLYPQLNVPAKLSFYDIQFDEELEEANIEKDGGSYSVSDLTYEDGTLTFSVGNFSTYNVVITPQGGYNLEENNQEEVVDEPVVEPEPQEPIETESDVVDEEPLIEDEVLFEEADNETLLDDDTQVEDTAPLTNSTSDEDKPVVEDDEPEQKGPKKTDPLLIAGLIVGFLAVILLILWLIRRKSGGAMLRKY